MDSVILQQLTAVNSEILLKLNKIDALKPIDDVFHILVLELQGFTEQREVCLKTLMSHSEFIDRQFLVDQLNFSQILITRSTKVMEDCRALVQVDNNAKRHIKAYKAIESNR
ncbi:hypothetical protein [Shewanella glacialipiscicola]|uniref:Uncharacterized protein n=1 Tax=Shewanella glacialipiscicola TaxID=614069 RepID=A0ABQ6J1L9_9GAMM|nr:hypothetical protein [Shewanella glacialipiscicola]MCL1085148.1 hypothetical protein [Shewanella glacialipiscicola]GIU07354.1 hypothetical protein TUM4636_10590 [Shewanella glacialipiscicola]GMA81348.1 hypothetical protein GCM10025855_08810 [Shewanella glacialipiscicola]